MILREGWDYQRSTSNWRPYPDYGKLPNFRYLSWSATPTNGREPDDFRSRAQIKRLFEESELVSGDSEAFRKFSDKYIFPEKLVAEYVEHLAQIKMRKEKKKEETDFIPEPRAETLPPSKYGRRQARVERDDYVHWEKIVFSYNISTPVNNLD